MGDNGTLVAWYGAIVSTALGALQVYRFLVEQKEKKIRVKVKLKLGFMKQGPTQSETLLFISAVNVGNRPVTLSFPQIRLPDGKYYMRIPDGSESDATFPHELLPGRMCQAWRAIRKMAEDFKDEGYSGKVKIIGEFRDAADNSYKSEPTDFDIDVWLRDST